MSVTFTDWQARTGITSSALLGMAAKRADPLPRELRRFSVKQVRATKSGGGTASLVDIDGYACVTNEPYTVNDWYGEYTEMIEAGAFTKTLKEKDDVRLLFNHDGIPLARTKSETLSLEEDDTGLKIDATLDGRMTVSNDVHIAIERGDLDEMSFAFQVLRQSWSPDYSQRTIHEVKLFDVSVVTFPANPATSVKLRAADFLLNNLSDADAEEFLQRYSKPKTEPGNAEKLALRRRQIALLDLR